MNIDEILKSLKGNDNTQIVIFCGSTGFGIKEVTVNFEILATEEMSDTITVADLKKQLENKRLEQIENGENESLEQSIKVRIHEGLYEIARIEFIPDQPELFINLEKGCIEDFPFLPTK